MAKIEVRFKEVALMEVPLDKPLITIGRSKKNDVVIDNMAVSRQHARIYREGPRFVVEDLKSLNGTFVNNRKASQWILSDRDRIVIGKHTLVFIDDNTPLPRDRVGTDRPNIEQTLVLETKKQRELLAEVPKGRTEERPKEIQGGITVLSGRAGHQDIKLTKRLTVAGKGEHADIKLRGLFLGKTVFLISKRPSGFYISSSGGRTTIRIRGVPIVDQQELKDGDIISVGRTKMQFYIEP